MNINKMLKSMGDRESKVAVTLGQVTLPIDLALELVFRQQSQIFTALNDFQGQLAIVENGMSGLTERGEHLHNDLLEMRQGFEALTKHPVERTDDETEQRAKSSKKKVH